MENLKNIQPVEDFNWDAFEQGETYTEVSKDDLVKTYDETLNHGKRQRSGYGYRYFYEQT